MPVTTFRASPHRCPFCRPLRMRWRAFDRGGSGQKGRGARHATVTCILRCKRQSLVVCVGMPIRLCTSSLPRTQSMCTMCTSNPRALACQLQAQTSNLPSQLACRPPLLCDARVYVCGPACCTCPPMPHCIQERRGLLFPPLLDFLRLLNRCTNAVVVDAGPGQALARCCLCTAVPTWTPAATTTPATLQIETGPLPPILTQIPGS